MLRRRARWDVLCRVVDNYGDAGVAWRLARQLAGDLGQSVRLVVDRPEVLARLVPGAGAGGTLVDGVRIEKLAHVEHGGTDADVVVDAFGGGVPAAWIETMRARARPPVWIVLEYLSAETWVDGAHGLPSRHPATGLERTVWCPGFTPASGGLLLEPGLLEARDRFHADATQRSATLRVLGVDAVPDARVVLVFAYPQAPLGPLLDAWSAAATPTIALVPQSTAPAAVDAWTGGRLPAIGALFVRESLSLATIPFVPQAEFDRLLWSCDLGIVRGEDSFVRAQWAAMPFLWHAYPQDGGAQRDKVEAFLDRWLDGADPEVATPARAAMRALDRGDGPALAAAWGPFDAARTTLAGHGRRWAAGLGARGDLASRLADHALSRL